MINNIYKHLNKNNLIKKEIYLDEVVKEMELHYPSSRFSRASVSYRDIASVWLYEIPHIVLRYRWFKVIGDDGYIDPSQIQISKKEIAAKFNYRYGGGLKWLTWFETKYPLYHITKLGNSQTQKRSIGIPTMHLINNLLKSKPESFKHSYDAERESIYAQAKLDNQKVHEHTVEIDMENLFRYLANTFDTWGKSNYDPNNKLKQYITHALNIYKLAEYHNDPVQYLEFDHPFYRIPQLYTTHFSGRRYYKGSFALQRMNSVVRGAALGPCYEVDLRASVYTYYYGLLTNFRPDINTTILKDLINDKHTFRKELAALLKDTNASDSKKIDYIKEAITGLGFGARDAGPKSSLAKVIRSASDRKRLTNSRQWKMLKEVKEAVMDIIKTEPVFEESELEYRKHIAGLNAHILLDKHKKKFSWNSVLATEYQKYESTVMTECLEPVLAYRDVLLWVHDGLYVRLNPDTEEVNHQLQLITGNELAFADKTQIEKYRYEQKDLKQASIDAHLQRIADQQAKAETYIPKNNLIKTNSVKDPNGKELTIEEKLMQVDPSYAAKKAEELLAAAGFKF